MLVTKDLQIPIINSRCGELLDLPAEFIEQPPRFDQLIEYQAHAADLARSAAGTTVPSTQRRADPRTDAAQFAISERKMPNGSVIEVRSGHLPDGSFVQTFTDITKRCEAEAHVARLASEDPLTGLPNRRVFRATLDQRQPAAPHRAEWGAPAAGLCRPVPRSRPLQGRQRHARTQDRRSVAAGGGASA